MAMRARGDSERKGDESIVKDGVSRRISRTTPCCTKWPSRYLYNVVVRDAGLVGVTEFRREKNFAVGKSIFLIMSEELEVLSRCYV